MPLNPILVVEIFYVWGIVGKQVTQTCLAILNGEANLSALNQTVVVLIPKGRLQNFAQ